MAVYDLQEQEQLDEIKTWWKQHGNLVTSILLAAAIGVAGWQGWNWYQGRQSAQAAVVFGVLQKAALEGDAQRLKAAAGELLENYKGSTYASLGALTAAKVAFDGGDLKTAKVQLAWVAGGATGVLIYTDLTVGFTTITAVLILGLAQTIVSYRGESLIPGLGGNRPVLAAREGGSAPLAAQ